MSNGSNKKATASTAGAAARKARGQKGDDAFWAQIGPTLEFEGGYVDDPADSGGETNFGISKRSYPDLDIAALSVDDAMSIYKRDFWDAPGLARLNDPPAGKVFDLAVNMGQRQATRLLQRAVNRLGAAPPLNTDGSLGKFTVAAANALDGVQLLDALRDEAGRFYRGIVRSKPERAKFLNGWLRRAAA